MGRKPKRPPMWWACKTCGNGEFIHLNGARLMRFGLPEKVEKPGRSAMVPQELKKYGKDDLLCVDCKTILQVRDLIDSDEVKKAPADRVDIDPENDLKTDPKTDLKTDPKNDAKNENAADAQDVQDIPDVQDDRDVPDGTKKKGLAGRSGTAGTAGTAEMSGMAGPDPAAQESRSPAWRT